MRTAQDFTQIPWVKAQFVSKLGIDPFPGTLNLEIIDRHSLRVLKELKRTSGILLEPLDPAFCSASCHPVVINSKLKGAIVIPMVDDYPDEKLEIICHVNVREALSVDSGSEVELEIV